ncbi:lipoate-protein ligase B [Terrimonas sp.]|uniref:lipoyl(octanoyl) transferase LipB n=1 Tax=Terrimonas sp. TaxID=1914338 RepID=UPI000D5068F2|nr:lipoyl(octanoyl) transferase LipB [Terrimonas sp.]PVD53754.1 lipoate-protein ligase B [Terrimonas sp.]
MQEVFFKDLGDIAYKQAWDYQEALLQQNVEAKSQYATSQNTVPVNTQTNNASEAATRHYLLLCEHPPVYTLGKSGKAAHILISEEDRVKKGIEYYPTNRGGDITFHGPGQIVGYPVLDLEKYYTDIGKYLRNLEEVIIFTLAAYNIKGERSAGETGVWIEPSVKGRERKICAMGVRCSRWVTMHGFALNVNTNLDYFNYIIPCGIQNKQVTSLAKELGFDADMEEVKTILKENFEKVFDCTLVSGWSDL